MRSLGFTALFAIALAPLAHTQTAEERIALALRPLPAEYRDGASVLAFDEKGDAEVLRQGTNGWTCVADGPAPGIEVWCHFETWAALRMRFYELLAQGASRREVWDICEAEMKAGKLPQITPAVGFELVGTSPANAQPYALFFMPYATPESLGLSAEPDNRRPWLMAAGRINAHIMAH